MPFLLAEDPPPATEPQGGGLGSMIVPILLMWGVIWFIVLRPQKKQEKERKARVDALKKGDKVRTRGGIVAHVLRVKDDEAILGVGGDRGVELTVHKGYIEEVYAAAGKTDADGKQ